MPSTSQVSWTKCIQSRTILNEIADKYYKPGEFTTFCSYEWTSISQSQNMHRNAFFKDCAKVPEAPFSAIDSDYRLRCLSRVQPP
jgi:hypothetical protein